MMSYSENIPVKVTGYLDLVYDETDSGIYFSKDSVCRIFAAQCFSDILPGIKVKVGNNPPDRRIEEVLSEETLYEIILMSQGQDAYETIKNIACKLIPYYIKGYTLGRPRKRAYNFPPLLNTYNTVLRSAALFPSLAKEREDGYYSLFGYYYDNEGVCHMDDQKGTIIRVIQRIPERVTNLMSEING